MRWLSGICCLLLGLNLWAEQRDGYTIHDISIPVSMSDSAQAYLLIPDSDSQPEEGFPAVLLMHDHGAYFAIGRDKMVSPTASARDELQSAAKAWTNKYYEGIFLGDSLAKAGYVVLVIDALYWGSRQSHLDQVAFYQSYLNRTGQAWFETILADDKCSIDYLAQLPYVNPKRIGVCGFSMGAYRAWQLASEDKRVSLCVAANWMTTLSANGGGLKNASAYSMYRPTMTEQEYGEIAGKIAPRPFLLIYGTQDKLFPTETVHQAIEMIKQHYLQSASESAFEYIEVDAPHRFTTKHLQKVRTFLQEHL